MPFLSEASSCLERFSFEEDIFELPSLHVFYYNHSLIYVTSLFSFLSIKFKLIKIKPELFNLSREGGGEGDLYNQNFFFVLDLDV